jgi:hypothetical protein
VERFVIAGSRKPAQLKTSGPWLDGMISACATSGEDASFQSQQMECAEQAARISL